MHRADAPTVRGEEPGAERVMTESESALFARVSAGAPVAPPCEVDVELADGDVVDFAGGAEIIGAPGHTDGSIGIFLRRHGVLFTGDLIVNSPDGPHLGIFNTDRELAKDSFLRLTALSATIVGFGHADPLRDGAAWTALGERCAADRNAIPSPFG